MRCEAIGCDRDSKALGVCLMHYRRLRRHGDPNIRVEAPPGQAWSITGGGYVRVSEGAEHRIKAQRALGRNLRGTENVHHVNNRGVDNRNTNLVICPDQAYHSLLHMREKAIDACGDPTKRKCVYCKVWDEVKNFSVRDKGPKGTEYRHRACHAANQLARKHRRNVGSLSLEHNGVK